MIPQEFTMDSYVADIDSNPAHTTLIFTLKEEAGALAETLKVFKVLFCRQFESFLSSQQKRINLTHIESRPSKVHSGCYEIVSELCQRSFIFESLKDGRMR